MATVITLDITAPKTTLIRQYAVAHAALRATLAGQGLVLTTRDQGPHTFADGGVLSMDRTGTNADGTTTWTATVRVTAK